MELASAVKTVLQAEFERQYVSESSRIVAIAFQRQLTLRYPTREELQARSLFK